MFEIVVYSHNNITPWKELTTEEYAKYAIFGKYLYVVCVCFASSNCWLEEFVI